jgi:NAD(P)-dependent dehydrogenase (short-subunit alcohol dehydrogenase family)
MKTRGFGHLIYVGSSAGARGARGQAAYAAAKSGLEGLMRSSALEGARQGVTANLLELGLVDTERIREAVKPEVRERIIARTPVGRLGEPTEIADAVAFLSSPRASFITGAVLPVSGGLGLGLYPEQLA